MIVIPMAGMSSRFFKAGYTLPKYMLDAHGSSLFSHCVSSFSQYFSTEHFLFIIRDVFDTEEFVNRECKKLGISDYSIVTLQSETRGQAETVYLGLTSTNARKDDPITIFNIDTIRPGFLHPEICSTVDGYLEVFRGSGDNWSFAKEDPHNPGRVIETAEKNPISDLCSDGLYFFRSAALFMEYYIKMEQDGKNGMTKGELYIAPMYNYLIRDERFISYKLINPVDIIFSGTPDEYTVLLQSDKLTGLKAE
ncbi:MAG: glycosyltransferase family 2 protein [Saccharospirillaceae bacterium]|nr:glycosyltransferase family 2 protein [Saccharospirillaceae bacterium]MCD8533214.1 glycosyltransferase family 2 protein [Saccharospirillaceae bacterium]